MFLKRIDVLGFKSFADKTAVEFSPGITAVVGPNGSGKSNIADAVRWVLGEQSARSLRGTKMEDVIFAGSETRRSINFCEVSLTLDNTDRHLPVVFDEVTITRRVYRSGESEYLLNKQGCRLKDIHELFMDSGLGRESYSIIGQGKIEEMLSTRPEDRRGPFEDAAGIVKYKFRRRDAERKFEETDTNLVRVDDILSELEDQAGPLEKEALRAQTYGALEAERTRLDISLLVYDIEQLQAKWQGASEAVKTTQTSRDRAKADLQSVERKMDAVSQQMESVQAEFEIAQKQLLTSTQERERLEGYFTLLQERLQNANTAQVDKQAQMAQVEHEQAELLTVHEGLLARQQVVISKLEMQFASLQVAAEQMDPRLRTVIEANIARMNSEIIECHHEAATHRNELKSAEETSIMEERKRERFLQDRTRIQAERDALTLLAEQTTAEMNEKKKIVSRLVQVRDQLSLELRDMAAREAAAAGEIQQLESLMGSHRSRIDLLRDLEQGYDGYALGVKTVLQAADKGRLTGIRGALASLIHVSKAHEIAIETALGGALQNIVVDTETAARTAILMLKERQAGRATFMPIDVIQGRNLHSSELAKLLSLSGFVGVASSLVTVESMYDKIVAHLLGNVVVADNLKSANDLARSLQYKVRIVTLEGDVVSPGGVMSGGSHSRKGPGLLGRSREKDSLEQACQEAENRLQTVRTLQSTLRDEMTALRAREQETDRSAKQHQVELTDLATILREQSVKWQAFEERLQALAWEEGQLQTSQDDRLVHLDRTQSALNQTMARLAELETAVLNERAALEAWDASVSEAQSALTVLRVEVATLTQERDSICVRVSEVTERLLRVAERMHRLQADIDEIQTTRSQTEAEMMQTQDDSSLSLHQLQDLESRLQKLRQHRVEVDGTLDSSREQVRRQQHALSSAEEQLHRAEVTAERLDVELNHALTKIGEVHQMSFEWAKNHHSLELPADEARRQMERLRRDMDRLGQVQIGAIEEWKRLSERLTFLTNQRADLLDAKAQLLAVISEIDEEMSRRFVETFAQIRTEFQVAFRQLFNGGKANLELTDPNHLLESGIEVTAQPPGKSLQNLNLLSGGERALTAMALLFAILRVRPVPFCVLDEVEAALDEANVSRFAQMLRSFADETQFIVITHRRGTMEEADSLYGVTMQESGISSLIGVRLTENLDMETA